MNKQTITDILKKHLQNEEFINLWWDLKLPGLGMASPNEVWERDPEIVLEYAQGYGDHA